MVEVETAWPAVRFEAIREAWALYRRHWAVWSLTLLVAMMCTLIGSGLVALVLAVASVGMFGGLLGLEGSGLPLVNGAFAITIAGFFLGGMVRMAINQTRGQPPHVGDLFHVHDDWFDLALGSFLLAFPLMIGWSLFVIPGLIVGGLSIFMYPLIVDARLPATGAMIRSFHAVRPQWVVASAVHLAIATAAGSGILLFFIGLLVTGPLYALSLAVLYRDAFLSPSSPSWEKPRNPFEDF